MARNEDIGEFVNKFSFRRFIREQPEVYAAFKKEYKLNQERLEQYRQQQEELRHPKGYN